MIEHILNSLNLSVIINLGYSNMSYVFLDKYVNKIDWSEIVENIDKYKGIIPFLRTKFKFEDFGTNYLCSAIATKHLKIVKLLIQKGANVRYLNDSPLRIASKLGNSKSVKLFLATGTNVHADNDDAVKSASEYGQLEVVKILLYKGANIRTDNDYALRCAIMNLHYKIVNILLEKGANIYQVSNISLALTRNNTELNSKVAQIIKKFLK